MKRRSFLAGLLGLPAAAAVVGKEDSVPMFQGIPLECEKDIGGYAMGNWDARGYDHTTNAAVYHRVEGRWTVSDWGELEECLGDSNDLRSSS